MTAQSESLAGAMNALGVSVASPVGEVEAHGDWAVIGSILWYREAIRVVPRLALTYGQWLRLAAIVGQVWLRGRFALEEWRPHPTLGWVADVKVAQVPDIQSECSVASRAICSSDVRVPETSAGSSDPSIR